MKIKNIIASGCSFTSNGLGGTPPTKDNPGSNCFNDNQCVAQTWVSHLAKMIAPISFVNLGACGHGNTLISKTLIDTVAKFNYSPDNTLVLFNISSIDRLDVVCEYNTDNKEIKWTQDILDYSFRPVYGPHWRNSLLSTESVEDVEQQSIESLVQLFDFLNSTGYPYAFTTMKDYTNLDVVVQNSDHLVPLPNVGMYEYAKSIDQIAIDGFHPSVSAHCQIAEYTLNFVKEKYKCV